eukprot:gene17638-9282_t
MAERSLYEQPEDIFEVERILDARSQDNYLYYLVHWKGYTSADDTWEPSENLLTCQELVDNYWKERDERSEHRKALRKERKRQLAEAKETKEKVASQSEQWLQNRSSERPPLLGATRHDMVDNSQPSSSQKSTQLQSSIEARKNTKPQADAWSIKSLGHSNKSETSGGMQVKTEFIIGDSDNDDVAKGRAKDDTSVFSTFPSSSSSESEEDEKDRRARQLIAKWQEMRLNSKGKSPGSKNKYTPSPKDKLKRGKTPQRHYGLENSAKESLARRGGKLSDVMAKVSHKEAESKPVVDGTNVHGQSKFLLPEKHRPASFNTISNILQEDIREWDEKLRLTPEKVKDTTKGISPAKRSVESSPLTSLEVTSSKPVLKPVSNPFAKVNLYPRMDQVGTSSPKKELNAQDSTLQKKGGVTLDQEPRQNHKGVEAEKRLLSASNLEPVLSDHDQGGTKQDQVGLKETQVDPKKDQVGPKKDIITSGRTLFVDSDLLKENQVGSKQNQIEPKKDSIPSGQNLFVESDLMKRIKNLDVNIKQMKTESKAFAPKSKPEPSNLNAQSKKTAPDETIEKSDLKLNETFTKQDMKDGENKESDNSATASNEKEQKRENKESGITSSIVDASSSTVTSSIEKKEQKNRMNLSLDKLNLDLGKIKVIFEAKFGREEKPRSKVHAAASDSDSSEHTSTGKVDNLRDEKAPFYKEEHLKTETNQSLVEDEKSCGESQGEDMGERFNGNTDLTNPGGIPANAEDRNRGIADAATNNKPEAAPTNISENVDLNNDVAGKGTSPLDGIADKKPQLPKEQKEEEARMCVDSKESKTDKNKQQSQNETGEKNKTNDYENSGKGGKRNSSLTVNKEKSLRPEKKGEVKGTMTKVKSPSMNEGNLFEFTKVKSVASNEQSIKPKIGSKKGIDDADQKKKVSIDPSKKARYAYQKQPNKEAFVPTKDDILGGILGRSEMMKSIDDKSDKREEAKENLEQKKAIENENTKKLGEANDIFDFDEFHVDERGLFPSDNDDDNEFFQSISANDVYPVQTSQDTFVKAVRAGDWEQILGAVAWGMDADYWDIETKGTLLWKAIESDEYDVATKLLALGASVNYKAENGKTALMLAVEHGKAGFVIILLRAGANINAQQHNEETALILACRKGHEDIISILLSYGADAKLIPKSNPKDVYEFSPDYKHISIKKMIEKYNRLLVSTAETMLKLTLETNGAQLHPHQLCRIISPGEKTITELYFNCQQNAGEKGL